MSVNEQVTDSVTQVNTATIGGSPAMATGNLLIATGHALGTAALNAASANQQSGITMQTVTIQGINSLVATGSSVIGRSSEILLEKG